LSAPLALIVENAPMDILGQSIITVLLLPENEFLGVVKRLEMIRTQFGNLTCIGAALSGG